MTRWHIYLIIRTYGRSRSATFNLFQLMGQRVRRKISTMVLFKAFSCLLMEIEIVKVGSYPENLNPLKFATLNNDSRRSRRSIVVSLLGRPVKTDQKWARAHVKRSSLKQILLARSMKCLKWTLFGWRF